MSFCTEDEDTVNASIGDTIREIRQKLEAGEFPAKPYSLNTNIGNSYWPTHPSASNHPVDDYKWEERYDHPKD